jgi:hypothetical protein
MFALQLISGHPQKEEILASILPPMYSALNAIKTNALSPSQKQDYECEK